MTKFAIFHRFAEDQRLGLPGRGHWIRTARPNRLNSEGFRVAGTPLGALNGFHDGEVGPDTARYWRVVNMETGDVTEYECKPPAPASWVLEQTA